MLLTADKVMKIILFELRLWDACEGVLMHIFCQIKNPWTQPETQTLNSEDCNANWWENWYFLLNTHSILGRRIPLVQNEINSLLLWRILILKFWIRCIFSPTHRGDDQLRNNVYKHSRERRKVPCSFQADLVQIQ